MNIDTDECFPEHPKTRKFCALIADPNGWHYIWKLWRFCKRYQKDGNLSEYEISQIELEVGWTAMDGRFFTAAVKARFIDQDAAGVRVHNWMRRAGVGLLRMDLDRLRKQLLKAKGDGDAKAVASIEQAMSEVRAKIAAVRTSDGIDENSAGTSGGIPEEGPENSTDGASSSVGNPGVSALFCSTLPSSTPARARDPGAGATEHERPPSPPQRPETVALGKWFAQARSDAFPSALAFHTPGFNRETAEWLAAIPDTLVPLLRPSMERFFVRVKERGKDWEDERLVKNVNWAFGAWKSRFPQLAEELLGRTPKVQAKKPDHPKRIGSYAVLDDLPELTGNP
jgi:hypothetical protein